MKNIKSTKNVNKANTAITTTSNEGYGLGSSKDGWDGITSEGDGYAVKGKAFTAWTVEIDGEISLYDVVGTRSLARSMRNDIAYSLDGYPAKVSVRKVMITPIKGR